MRCELGHDPDVIQIAALLGMDEFAVVGRLHAVWSWLDQHSENGTNVRIVSAYLDRLTACPGFADAMRTVGWLDGRDGNLTFPGYETHNGETAKRRAVETKRKREQRDKRPKKDGTFVPENTGPEKRREEVIIEREKNAGASIRRPTLDEAKTAAANMGVSAEKAEEWWHCREASEWLKGMAGGGTCPVGTNWQADLKTYASRSSIQPARPPITQPNHRAEKAAREYPEPKRKLPRL